MYMEEIFMQKKYMSPILCAVLAAAGLTACGNQAQAGNHNPADQNPSADQKISIVCTIFPEYDWVRQILGDHVRDTDLSYLLDSGVDLHNYQPTSPDMAKIAECDLFLYVGGESDEWVEDALAETVNPDIQVMNLMEVMGDAAKEEEIKEGMEHDEEEHDEKDHDHAAAETEYDEHVWLSLNNAKLFCTEIAERLCILDSANSADYKANLEAYTAQLDRLDGDFRTLTGNSQQKTLVFGDRFPFRYFADDYGLDYYAAFAGCSAETEASFETIVFLAEKADSLNCGTIFTIEKSDRRIAQTIIDNTRAKNQKIAELNSLQSVTKDQVGSVTYLSLMQSNYDVLKDALTEAE